MSASKEFVLIEECEISIAEQWIEFFGRYELEVIHVLSDFMEDGEPVAGVFVEKEAFEELIETDEIFAGNYNQMCTLIETIEAALDVLNNPVQVMLVLEPEDGEEEQDYEQMSMEDYEDLEDEDMYYDHPLNFDGEDLDD